MRASLRTIFIATGSKEQRERREFFPAIGGIRFPASQTVMRAATTLRVRGVFLISISAVQKKKSSYLGAATLSSGTTLDGHRGRLLRQRDL
jgi:hypothetical protein